MKGNVEDEEKKIAPQKISCISSIVEKKKAKV